MHTQEDFQLVEARTADVPLEMPWRREKPRMNPQAVFSQEPQHLKGQQREHITAVIGKNGTGKSHLLSSIVQTFIALESLQNGKRSTQNFALEYLDYRLNGKRCVLRRESHSRYAATVDGMMVATNELPLPQRVVALTNSPFDKFPVPRTIGHSVVPTEASMYHYLGLRDRFGKASIETLLFRSLNNLFETSENEALRRSNIGAVFQFLGLKPVLNVIYRLRTSATLRHAVMHNEDATFREILSPSQLRRMEEVERSGVTEDELFSLLQIAISRQTDKRVIETRADFQAGGIMDDLFRKLQPIRRAGFLNLSAVEVTQENGMPSDLKRASSGQLSIVSSLIALASVITNGSLVLIDEPELSLHPEWQVKYIDLLVKTFARYHGCHFVIATHSPMVISELPIHANVISLDRELLPPTQDLGGHSADYLLAEAFGLPTNGNLHVKERIVEALRLVARGKAKSTEFDETMKDLRRYADDLNEDDPSKVVINNLQEVADQAGKAIRP